MPLRPRARSGFLAEARRHSPFPRAPGIVIAAARSPAVLAAALAVLVALPDGAAAEPRALDARVVWARADRAYIAAQDSIALAPGDLLTFTHKRKHVASGEVAQVLARDLAAARLTLGSLARISRLDRVTIMAERPPLRRRPALRVGYPGRGRSHLLIDCARPEPRPPFPGNAYRPDSIAENAQRLVRVPDVATEVPWPDTILVRLFGEVADEEIALERGELDVAIFRPGEASSRLRADPRWQGPAARHRGVLAAIALGSGPGVEGAAGLSPDHPPLAALNENLFRGDLEPWRDAAGPSPHAQPASPGPAAGFRFTVDPSCPGRVALERFLDRVAPAEPAQSRPTEVRLFCLSSDAGSAEALARGTSRYLRGPSFPPEVRARADTLALEADRMATDPGAAERVRRYLRDSLHVTPLFTIRCALGVEPGLRAYVSALGPDALADIVACAPAGRAP